MFKAWFAKNEISDLRPSGSETNGTGNYASAARNEAVKRLIGPAQAAGDRTERNRKPDIPWTPPPFEQIYQNAAVKPPKLTYGIQKVAEMANSAHLVGLSPEHKRKALLMALEASGTDVGEVLNDVVTRQRALKEFEESFQERVNEFEAAQLDENRQHQAELDKITSEFRARIQANLDEVERRQDELRDWQKSKQQELQRFTEAASLCVPRERMEQEAEEEIEDDNKIMAIPQRATGTFR